MTQSIGTMERAFLSASEVGDRLGLKKSRVYQLVQSGDLHVVRLGRRVMFPREGLEELGRAAVQRALERQDRRDDGM